MRRRILVLPAVVTAGALLAGCTVSIGDSGDSGDSGNAGEEVVAQAVAAVPVDMVTAIPGSDGAGLSLRTSQLLHHSAPIAVVAAEGDVAGQAVAAAVAVARAAPLLVAASGGSATGLREELSRLGTEAVLAVGPVAAEAMTTLAGSATDPSGAFAVSVVSLPPESSPESYADLAEIAAAPLGEPLPTSAADAVAVVATLDTRTPAVPVIDPGPLAGPVPDPAQSAAPDAAPLPATTEGTRATDVVVLATGAPESLAAVATARAAGADVVVLDEPDPRTSPEAIAALAAASGPTVALGDAFGDPALLTRRVETAATGVELPGGGQVLFPHRRFVALYGSPGIPALGSMGEQPVAEAIQRAQQQAAEYEPHSPEAVVPAFEIITTVASGVPGDDGDYSYPIDATALREWIDAAGEAGVYVVLDLQPGRTDFLTQAQQYEEYLREPHVGLALDSEWRLKPDQVHLRQVGSVSAAEVNSVAAWLAQLTAENDLPQKLLLLHQFKLSMITERETLDLSHDELAVMIHADGFGTPGQKLDTWRVLRRDAPPVWWGWKNFYDEDQPTMSPAETMAIEPRPWFVSYQ
ncbi:MAG: hypothetical protein ACFCUP_03795 [Actinomycetales bacterium]